MGFETVSKLITGASNRGLNCFEPQTTVGVLTVPFSSQDIRALESAKGLGKPLMCSEISASISSAPISPVAVPR